MHPEPIYLDHNATSSLDPEVLDAMRPFFLTAGNAESRHAFGRAARRGWEMAKDTVARVLDADPGEVIFTSGGTEANNLAIFGLAGAESTPGQRCRAQSSTRRFPSRWHDWQRLDSSSTSRRVDRDGLADAKSMAALVAGGDAVCHAHAGK